jgi:predicted TPR repeat methyltransferase
VSSFQSSSGDILADCRVGYAEMLFESGDFAAGAELMSGALELAPDWAAGWFRLGEIWHAAGDLSRAGEAWRMALRLDPVDRIGAALKLALIGGVATPVPPQAFVEALFDQYANRFESSLVGKLGYCVPELLVQALQATGRTSFAHAVDLGCGTGLMGERLRGIASFLEGVDLSGEMLKKAAAKHIYDRLTKSDLQVFEPAAAKPDLVTAADVFIYLEALDDVFARVAVALASGGLFGFSVEKHDGPEPRKLRTSRRYAHSESHVRDLLARHGFSVLTMTTAVIRRDQGEPQNGLIVVAEPTGLQETTPLAVSATPVAEEAAFLQ